MQEEVGSIGDSDMDGVYIIFNLNKFNLNKGCINKYIGTIYYIFTIIPSFDSCTLTQKPFVRPTSCTDW